MTSFLGSKRSRNPLILEETEPSKKKSASSSSGYALPPVRTRSYVKQRIERFCAIRQNNQILRKDPIITSEDEDEEEQAQPRRKQRSTGFPGEYSGNYYDIDCLDNDCVSEIDDEQGDVNNHVSEDSDYLEENLNNFSDGSSSSEIISSSDHKSRRKPFKKDKPIFNGRRIVWSSESEGSSRSSESGRDNDLIDLLDSETEESEEQYFLDPLVRLEEYLKNVCAPYIGERCVFTTEELIDDPELFLEAKRSLKSLSFVVLKGGLSEAGHGTSLGLLGESLVEMWPSIFENEEGLLLKKRLLAGYIDSINPHRNLSNDMSGLSFGEFRKQPLSPEKYPQYDIYGETVHFDINPIYSRVMIPTLARDDNRATLECLRVLVTDNYKQGLIQRAEKHEEYKRSMLCPSSISYSSSPSPKPRTMTTQTLKTMQVPKNLNETQLSRVPIRATYLREEKIKMFFIPGSDREVFREILENASRNCDDYNPKSEKIHWSLEPLLSKYSFAIPSNSIVIWNSGVISFEAQASEEPIKEGPFEGCYSVDKIKPCKNQSRFRFPLDFAPVSDVDINTLRQFALIAEEGFTPALVGTHVNNGEFIDSILPSRTIHAHKNTRLLTKEETKLFSVCDTTAQSSFDAEEISSYELSKLVASKIESEKIKELYGIVPFRFEKLDVSFIPGYLPSTK